MTNWRMGKTEKKNIYIVCFQTNKGFHWRVSAFIFIFRIQFTLHTNSIEMKIIE